MEHLCPTLQVLLIVYKHPCILASINWMCLTASVYTCMYMTIILISYEGQKLLERQHCWYLLLVTIKCLILEMPVPLYTHRVTQDRIFSTLCPWIFLACYCRVGIFGNRRKEVNEFCAAAQRANTAGSNAKILRMSMRWSNTCCPRTMSFPRHSSHTWHACKLSCVFTHKNAHARTQAQADARLWPVRALVLWFTIGGRERAFIVLL